MRIRYDETKLKFWSGGRGVDIWTTQCKERYHTVADSRIDAIPLKNAIEIMHGLMNG